MDPLASPGAVRAVCDHLRERLPELIPRSEKELLRFLYAVRHIERRPATDSRRGRPGHWRREDLLKAAGALRSILERETGGGFSLQLRREVSTPCSTSLPTSRIRSHQDRLISRKPRNWHGCRLIVWGARRRRRMPAVVSYSTRTW